ncbi:unnamed protein product, partial [Urochloa humidicola]
FISVAIEEGGLEHIVAALSVVPLEELKGYLFFKY